MTTILAIAALTAPLAGCGGSSAVSSPESTSQPEATSPPVSEVAEATILWKRMSFALADAKRLQRVVAACADDYRAADGRADAKKAAMECIRESTRKVTRKSKEAMVFSAALFNYSREAIRQARAGPSP